MSDGQLNSVELDEQREKAKSVEVPRENGPSLDKDDSFVSWLNMRMKSAEWGTYERGSEAFLGIDQDLEKLSKANAEMARGLWKENTPPGTRLPFYLTPEFEKAANAQRTAEPGQVPADERKAPKEPQKRASEAEKAEGFKVPDEIKRRYLATENKFFFRDEKNKLAFEDRGRKMVTEHNDPDVAKSLVDLAEAKGWNKIKVAGHDEFKREVWLQATLKGIEVTGYKPKEVDYAKLQEMQSARAKNSVERDEGRDVTGQQKGKDKDVRVPEEERAYAAPGQDKSANFKGKLVEHGRANYDFDEKKEQSYFVKIETENGTKMHWGVDLGRAMEHAGAKIGEMIELARLGKRPVTVQEKEFDGDGKLIGHKAVETERVEWSVGGIEQSKAATKAADVSVKGSTAKTVDIEMPVAVVKAKEQNAELTPAKSKDAAAKVPELKGEYMVPVSVFAEVLKEKGYSAKTIERAQVEATKRLGAMAEKGQPAPGVKVFDRNAERERPREKIVSKTKENQQERSR